MGDSRQEQDVLVAVKSQVMTILSYGKKSLIEIKMFPVSKVSISSQDK